MIGRGDEPNHEPHIRQEIHAINGVAYGVIGADLHVFGDGVPLYALEQWRRAPEASAAWLRELPSRMLDARRAVVPFTGRDVELAQLRQWRQSAPRLAVHWLHGPGGAGKTRLAHEFAAETASPPVGWKVVTATHGPGTVLGSHSQQDLRLDGTAGLLLIIDYADRWPLTHLTWLFSNRLLHQSGVRTRVLLLARGADTWPAVRAVLTDHEPATSSQMLESLPAGHRSTMFVAARDSFAVRYVLTDPAMIAPPAQLDQDDFGLTLAVHMAALVAVDAHPTSRPPPGGMAGLTVYLLDREHAHWARLYGDGTHELNPSERVYRTPPHDMNRVVFAAALTGAAPKPAGIRILRRLTLGTDTEQLVRDHTHCYPPADRRHRTTLEPLYPDRLAEDFLALTIPGHRADYPTQGWATSTAMTLLIRDSDNLTAQTWSPRAVAFLTAAAARWSHVGPECLYPLLRRDPRLAIEAGNATLSTLAAIGDVELDILRSIEEWLPEDRHIDIDAGSAAVLDRLTQAQLAETDDPAERAKLRHTLALRLANAGEFERSLVEGEGALAIYRRLVEQDPKYLGQLGTALSGVANQLGRLGRVEEALALSGEAVEIIRRVAEELAERQPQTLQGVARKQGKRGLALHHAHLVDSADLPALAVALNNHGTFLAQMGRQEEAISAAEESVAISRRLAEINAASHSGALAMALHNLGNRLEDAGHRAEALACAEEAATIWRRLAAEEPAVYLPDLGLALASLRSSQTNSGHHNEALATAHESAEVARRLIQDDVITHLPVLAYALVSLCTALSTLGRMHDTLAAGSEAVTIWRQLAEANPAAHERMLANSLTSLSNRMAELGRPDDALAAITESVAIQRRLATSNAAHEGDLCDSLTNLGNRLVELGRPADALAPAEESVTIRRRLAASNPTGQQDGLASSLHNLSIVLARLRRHANALAADEEALRIVRRLTSANPGGYRHLLAVILGSVGTRLVNLDRPQDALAPTEEAVTMLRELATANPGAHRTDLITYLNNLGELLIRLGRPDDGLVLLGEAIMNQRQLATAVPAMHLVNLAKSLSTLGDRLVQLGRPDHAVRAYQEAAEICRTLPAEHRAANLELATTLNNLGQTLLDLKRIEEAIAVTTEAVALQRTATNTDPTRGIALARSLTNVGLLLFYSQRHDEAFAATRDAVDQYRRSIATCPSHSDETILARALVAFAWVRINGKPRTAELAAAAGSAAEAVDLYQRLTEAHPEEYGADLRTATEILASARSTRS